MKKTILFLLVIIFHSCSPVVNMDEYFLLENDEILTIRKFDKNLSIPAIPLVGIIEAGSDNFEIIKKAVAEIEVWNRITASPSKAKMVISGIDFDLFVYEDHVIFKDKNNRELLGKSSILQKLTTLDYGTNNHELEEFYGRGYLVSDKTIFCSFVPVYKEYEYKKEYWKIWDKEFRLLGEGNFIIKEKVPLKETSCGEVRVRYEVIDRANWRNYYQGNEPLDSIFHRIEISGPKKYPKLPLQLLE